MKFNKEELDAISLIGYFMAIRSHTLNSKGDDICKMLYKVFGWKRPVADDDLRFDKQLEKAQSLGEIGDIDEDLFDTIGYLSSEQKDCVSAFLLIIGCSDGALNPEGLEFYDVMTSDCNMSALTFAEAYNFIGKYFEASGDSIQLEPIGSKVRVYGKAQNRTALGIVNAYMVIHPEATISELQKAFPDWLNPDSGVKKNFVMEGEKGTTAAWDGFFSKEEELIPTGNGTRVALVKMWTKPSFERLVDYAAYYGIEIAQFDAAEGGGKKGSFRLEYLNGFVPPKDKKSEAPVSVPPVIPTPPKKANPKSKPSKKQSVIS